MRNPSHRPERPRTIPRSGATPVAWTLCLLGLLGWPAAAHDMWIMPSTFRPSPDEPTQIQLKIGHARTPEPVARDSDRILRFTLASVKGVQPVHGLNGADPAGLIRVTSAGPHVVLYESRETRIELPADLFRDYLVEEGLEHVLDDRAAYREEQDPGREVYSRALKSLLIAGDAVSFEDRPAGLPLELVIDGRQPDGPDAGLLNVRLLFMGEPLRGAQVDAEKLDGTRSVAVARTDDRGRVRFPIEPGAWLLTAVHMERTSQPDADWRSFWTSLTFEAAADRRQEPVRASAPTASR